jgi:zinc protease
MWGLPGIKRDDPDYFAAVLMNFVLGGSTFNSRLYSEVREKRGLAYSVYSSVVPFERSALLMGGVGTANERVGQSLDLVRGEIRSIAEKGITDEELALAKTYTVGSFALSLDSNARIAQALISLQIYNLGLDYLDKRAGIINAITKADVQRIAQRLLRADAMTVIVVGDPKDVVSAAGKPPG